jgi:hypothetical protein
MESYLKILTKIISELEALQPRDFNLDYEDAFGLETLNRLADELMANASPEITAQTLLAFTERLSRSMEIDASSDLGAPGPIVHTLEKIPDYEKYLIESVKRFPTPLTVWMINRILNVTTEKSKEEFWMTMLEEVVSNDEVNDMTRKKAEGFLRFQNTR